MKIKHLLFIGSLIVFGCCLGHAEDVRTRTRFQTIDGTVSFTPSAVKVPNGNLINNGDVSATMPMAYGSFYATNISSTIVVTVANSSYPAGGFTAGSMSGFTMSGTTALVCDVAGTFHIVWNMSIDTSGVADEIEGGITKNGVGLINGTGHTTVAVLNDGTTIAGSAIVSLAETDSIGLFVKNHTNANDIILEHGNLTAVRVGGQ